MNYSKDVEERIRVLECRVKHGITVLEADKEELLKLQLGNVVAPVSFVLDCLINSGAVYTDKKVNIIKAVREATGLGLKEAKELVDNCLSKPFSGSW